MQRSWFKAWRRLYRREVSEEYSVQPTKVELVSVENVLRDNNGTPTHWIAAVHLVEVDPEQVNNGDPEKIEDLKWFTTNSFPEPLHSAFSNHYSLVKKYIENKI